MIHGVLIFNTSGAPRLTKWYTHLKNRNESRAILKKIFSLVASRPPTWCNFLDAPELKEVLEENLNIGKEVKVVYRNYATLYFVFIIDDNESELAILDLVQVFVEALDRVFENVCELDLVFHFDELHYLLREVIQGGLVLETNVDEIVDAYQEGADARKASYVEANPLSLGTGIGPRSSNMGTPLSWLTNKLTGSGSR